jgi:hypothetical protein
MRAWQVQQAGEPGDVLVLGLQRLAAGDTVGRIVFTP